MMIPRQRLLIALGLLALAAMLHFMLCTWKAGGMLYGSASAGTTQARIVGSIRVSPTNLPIPGPNSSVPSPRMPQNTASYWGLYSRVGVDLASAATLGVALPFALLMLDAFLILGWRHRARIRRRVCPNCGYDLRAATSPDAKCPECGMKVEQ